MLVDRGREMGAKVSRLKYGYKKYRNGHIPSRSRNC